jgi:hypothetical protein
MALRDPRPKMMMMMMVMGHECIWVGDWGESAGGGNGERKGY